MKWIKKIPAEDMERSRRLAESGWERLKEPRSLGMTIALAMPAAIVLMFLTGLWLYFLFPQLRQALEFESVVFRINLKLLLYGAGLFLYTFIHEGIHLLMIPGALRSDRTFMGMNGLFGFVYSEEVLTKGRFMLVSVMPLLVLSFAVPAVCRGLGIYSGYLALLCVLNAGGACVDLFNMFLAGRQVPKGGVLAGNGMATWYRA